MNRQRVVACVVEADGRFLLCQRPIHKRHGGLWEFPGGKVGLDESDENAAARELKEELGVTLLTAGAPLFEAADFGSPFVIAFIPVTIVGTPVALEHMSIAWTTLANIHTLPLAPSDRKFVEFLGSASRGNGPHTG